MMATMDSLKGMGVALVTPFQPDGKVDFPALQRLVEHMVAGGVDFLVVLGTTGETPTLSEEEQRRVLDFVLEVNGGRLPVVVGITGNNTAQLCTRLREWDWSGLSACLVAAPAYNKPSQRGLLAHYQHVADAAGCPVILYNVPGRTGCNLTAPTTLALSAHENICGIKEASGDMVQIGEILQGRPDGFMVWSGDDALAMPTVAMGAEGVISVLGNALPRRMADMIHQVAFGQVHEARATHLTLLPLIDLLFQEGNPVGIKLVLNHLGICQKDVRLPLVAGSSELRDKIYGALAALDVQTI